MVEPNQPRHTRNSDEVVSLDRFRFQGMLMLPPHRCSPFENVPHERTAEERFPGAFPDDP